MPGHHLCVVPHTHWDREWYRSHEQFRYQLIGLLDGLLELLEGDPAFRCFTLDGQLAPLDDYLEVRPGARARIEALVRAGRLQIGPWYVLPDEWLVSGEALIRNLRLGLHKAAELGGGMRLGYVPDQFGHVGQLPQILAGFGLEAALLWRGVGQGIEETCFEWEAPDGTRLFTVYLRQGYGNAGELPLEPEALAQRLAAARDGLAPHSRTRSLLLMNGGDHQRPQPGLPAALEAALAQLPGDTAEITSLPGFVARARREAPGDLPRHRGELRSGLRSPLLEGCASARIPLKQADFANDRLLSRWLEPLATWLAELGGDADPELLDWLWQRMLENHPHDSICGCSIDAVHREMETRFARVRDSAGEHLRRVAREWAARVEAPSGPGEPVVVWNPNAGGPACAEGRLQLDVPDRGQPALHAVDGEGRRLPVHAEVVEPGGIAARYEVPARVAAVLIEGFPAEWSGEHVRGLVRRRERGLPVAEVQLASEPRPGFDWSVERRALAASLAGDETWIFRVRRLPRLALRLVDSLPGYGLRSYRVVRGRAGDASALASGRAPGGGVWIENEAWRVDAGRDGRVCIASRTGGPSVEDALRIVSEGDRGDEYSFEPLAEGQGIGSPAAVRIALLGGSEAQVGLRVTARYRIPQQLGPGRERRSSRSVSMPVRLDLRLARGLDRIELDVELENRARDHRVRLWIRAPHRPERFEVESAFEIVERPIEPPADAFGPQPAERPTGAVPQRSFATLRDETRALTVANRGSPEVEALRDAGGGWLAVTLLRAVGWLSRDDLARRPGHAGPGLPTPEAQGPGLHRAQLGLRWHASGDPQRVSEAHRFAWPALLLPGSAGGGPLGDAERLLELDDPAVVVSAIEPRPDGSVALRLYNASAQARRVPVRWRGRAARRLRLCDHGGRARPGGAPSAKGGGAEIALGPWQIVSLRLD